MIPMHGGDVYRFEAAGRVLDFSANINPLGMPESVRRAAQAGTDNAERYPDPHCRRLKAAIARAEGVPEEWVIPGAGASDLLYRYAYALRPREALLTAPAFSEYEAALAASGCRALRFHSLKPEEGFRLNERILASVPSAGAVFLASPNNPTGGRIPPCLLRRILEACQGAEAHLLLDECFLDLTEEPERYTAVPYLSAFPRLFILKAFTKSYAMPGLRLGYGLCADAALLERMKRSGPPWAVSTPAQEAGVQALEEKGYLARSREYVRRERRYLAEGLQKCGLRVFPGEANYLLFRAPGLTDLHERLEACGILLRSCGNYRGLEPDYYRAAVRTHEENEAFLQALGRLLPPERSGWYG